MAPAFTSCCRFSSTICQFRPNITIPWKALPECVMFSRAPVAFLWTRMSFDFAKRVRGPKAPDLAIFALLSSCVARFVMQPTALHCTSTFGDIICRMRGVSPPRSTMDTLFSAANRLGTAQPTHQPTEDYHLLFTARFPSAALAAR